jgi:hypothetical protein
LAKTFIVPGRLAKTFILPGRFHEGSFCIWATCNRVFLAFRIFSTVIFAFRRFLTVIQVNLQYKILAFWKFLTIFFALLAVFNKFFVIIQNFFALMTVFDTIFVPGKSLKLNYSYPGDLRKRFYTRNCFWFRFVRTRKGGFYILKITGKRLL